MSFSVGIVGLPNVGKSTLFKALTKKQVDIADYPFTTIEPNVGIVPVPDERLEKISSLVNPEKTTETIIEFVDIAGLVKNAHKGEGLGNQFLSQIRICDAIIEIIGNFKEEKINPEADIDIIETELLNKDLEIIEKAVEKAQKEPEKSDILKKIKKELDNKIPIRKINLKKEEKSEIREYQFLTEKPIIYLLNIKENFKCSTPDVKHLTMDLKIEQEASELSENEKKEIKIDTKLDQLILACYNTLDLITFFTIKGGKETRAWTLKKGLNAIEAAEKVHSDFKEKFIRAEAINWQELINAGSWNKAKESGKIKTAGKDYIVQDGDIIEFKN